MLVNDLAGRHQHRRPDAAGADASTWIFSTRMPRSRSRKWCASGTRKPGYVLMRIGWPPKRAFLFRTHEPFAKILINLVRAQWQGAEKIEFLGDRATGRRCFGIHPETSKSYRWHGSEPGEIAREDLPYIREAEARALVDGLAEMLVADFGYVRAAERPRRKKSSRRCRHGTRRRRGLAISGRSHPCRRGAARLAARPGRQAGDLGHGGRRRRQLPAGA